MGNRWETVETMSDFIFWAPESLQMVTAAMKLRRLLLGRKVMTNLDSLLKSRDITLPTKAFELWCWRRLLRIPWTARRSNQSILKEISPGCFLEGMMLKLKL